MKTVNDPISSVAGTQLVTVTTRRGSLRDDAFPVKLHALLSEIDQSVHHSRVVAWRPHGRLFVVNDRHRFIQEVLPCWFFGMKNYASFQRQLNFYGFKRISTGPDKGGYYHELFLRGRPDLAARIPRQKLKGQGPRKPASPHDEPNFYSMPSIPRAPPIRSMLPSMANACARKFQDGHEGNAESFQGPFPLMRLCSVNLTQQPQQLYEQRQQPSWNPSFPPPLPLYSTVYGRLEASKKEEQYRQKFTFEFSNVSSLTPLGGSIAANQEEADQETMFTTMFTTTGQPASTSCKIFQDVLEAECRQGERHVGVRGIFAFEEDSDDDQQCSYNWDFSDLDLEPIKLFD